MEGVIRVFDRYGERKSRAKARMKFLLKDLGLDGFKELLEEPKHHWIDEKYFTGLLTKKQDESLNVFWEKYLISTRKGRAHQDYHLDKWKFDSGKLYKLTWFKKVEYMYLHFINWKEFMKDCEVTYPKNTDSFYISYNAIRLKKHSKIEVFFNAIKILINGYYAKRSRWKLIGEIKKM